LKLYNSAYTAAATFRVCQLEEGSALIGLSVYMGWVQKAGGKLKNMGMGPVIDMEGLEDRK